MDPTYPDEATCTAAMGPGRWMPAMCMDQTYPDEASCNAGGNSWGYYTMSTLDPMKGHASFFVENLVVDVQRGRTADPLTRDQARFLIDNPTEHVVLFDNVAALDQDGDIQDSAIIDGVTQGGTITNVDGNITSAHYHEYHVRYDHNWETYTNENKLEHGFIFEPITTWLCFNYDPSLPVDETIMGGQDFNGNPWPQNVFMEVPDSYVAMMTGNPDITLQHNQVWEENHDSKVDWVEIFSSNFIQQVPGSGDTGDLIGVEVIGTGTDIATIEAYPIPSYLTSSERAMWIHVQHTVMDNINGIVTAHTDLWAYLQEIMPDGFARIDFIKDGVINQLDLDAYTDEIYKERIIDDAYAVPALVTNFFLDATPQYPIAIVDMSGYIHLQNTTDGSIKDLLLDLSSIQHVIGLGSFANYDERGTLGLAFHPDYVNNGKFYVYYMTELDSSELGYFTTGAWGFPKSRTHISEFTADLSGARPIADISSERELLRVDQPDFNHNGGEVAFGPDGYLYIGLGDGGSADDTSWQGTHGEYGNAQNPTNLLGSVLRIDVTPDPIAGTEYTIPTDNPFINSLYKAGTPDEAPWRAEAFAYGFRNPWRFSWAPNGDFWVADVGQNKFEEINIVEKGGNYGWRIIEGYHAFEENQSLIDQAALDLGYANTVEFMNDLKEPIHEYTHGTGISILGGFVYRGAIPELIGKYIFGDWSTNWGGTSGHLYTLEEDSSGLSATFNVLANPTNGANHGHTCSLTAAQVALMKANPGTVVNVPQTDAVHAESYTHIFSIIWSSAGNGQFVLIGQTNTEGHDQLDFIEYSDAVGYIRKPLSIWDPAAQTVDLTTLGMSILTMGEDTDGEIYISTRVGINTFQPPSGAGPQNCTIAKITASYDSSVLGQTVIDQIPASEMAHVHSYKIEWDDNALSFIGEEISDIEMSVWDAFYPEWIENTPASHVHPLTIQWSNAVDSFIPVGSSAGWDGSAPYDIGADTAWAPPAQASDDYVSISASPIIVILASNEFAKESHEHYFSGVLLDTYGINYGRTSDVISRYDAEVLANAPQGTIHKLYGSIHEYPSGNRHYHEIDITYNTATKQFYGIEVSEWVEPVQGTGEYFLAESQTHEHGITVDGIVTAVGWSGNPIFEAPIIATYYAHDWDNLNGSEASHNHIFDGSGLDSVGPNVDRKANALTNEETTNLMDSSLEEVILYSRVVGDHYHSYRLTYDGPTNLILAEEIGLWLTDGSGQYFLQSTATHQHAVSVDGVITGTGYSETIDSTDLPVYASPGYPYPGGSHPHFHINTVVGPFPDGHIDYAHGLSVDEAQRLIDGVVTSVVIYDSIEGAHFHEYTIKWNDTTNKFYVSASTTWIRGGIEDQTQDSGKYYPATIMNESEGLHWHNLTIEWNPNDTVYPQQSGGSVYTTRVTSTDEVVYADPVTTTNSQSTELNPVSTTYPDTPTNGDITVITRYSDLVTVTIDISIQVTTTTTTTTYESDGTDYDTVQIPVITTNESTSSSSNTIEDMDERTTVVNSILQANNPPVIFIEPTFIDGEGTHDHVQFDGCTLDTVGTYAGRMCEEITLETANFLINAQDVNIASVFYDSPNGALAHYHSYKLKYNPFQGPDGAFIVNSFSQYDQVSGTGTSIHKFTLTGGFHTHDYWCTDAEYLSLVTGSQIIMVQRDSIHAESYTHTLTISYTGTYNIVNQTSDFDGHNLFVYNGVQITGGEWNEVSVTPGDHIHGTVIDESSVWPVSPS
jgi:glucose/arabinose dehydrogenase